MLYNTLVCVFGNVKNLIYTYNNITRVLKYYKHNSDGSLENRCNILYDLLEDFFYTRTMYLSKLLYRGKKNVYYTYFFMKTDNPIRFDTGLQSTCCGVFFTPALSHDTQEKRFREK